MEPASPTGGATFHALTVDFIPPMQAESVSWLGLATSGHRALPRDWRASLCCKRFYTCRQGAAVDLHCGGATVYRTHGDPQVLPPQARGTMSRRRDAAVAYTLVKTDFMGVSVHSRRVEHIARVPARMPDHDQRLRQCAGLCGVPGSSGHRLFAGTGHP